jgi:hypothetical protein
LLRQVQQDTIESDREVLEVHVLIAANEGSVELEKNGNWVLRE